jgi:hypothetical protein
MRGAALLKAFSVKAGRWLIRSFRRIASSMRFVHWHRRYFILTSWVHRAIFDRRVEKLLFIPTVHTPDKETEPRPLHFVYQGPLPSRVFNWALSALPADVKHYAFVDLNAGNGRTLLLAARRNFEYAIGYSFGAERSEELELNVAQYPRSYMSCRDVRVIRGDKEGVEFPPQPCVLFIPDKIRGSTLGTVLGYIAASWRMNPRPIYLIFENVTEGIMPLYQDIFKKTNPPLLNRIKLALFSPARVAIYRSVEEASPTGDVT